MSDFSFCETNAVLLGQTQADIRFAGILSKELEPLQP
jgi:hypothetical protein